MQSKLIYFVYSVDVTGHHISAEEEVRLLSFRPNSTSDCMSKRAPPCHMGEHHALRVPPWAKSSGPLLSCQALQAHVAKGCGDGKRCGKQ